MHDVRTDACHYKRPHIVVHVPFPRYAELADEQNLPHVPAFLHCTFVLIALNSGFRCKNNLLPRTHRDTQGLEITFSHVT